jgi:uracil-DNA glycosylase
MSVSKQKLEIRRRLGVKYVKTAVSIRPDRHVAPEVESRPSTASSITAEGRVESAVNMESKQKDPEPAWCLGEGCEADGLRAFRTQIKNCVKCPLGKTRTRFVFGAGHPRARVLFVGEAPGADEDAQGLPFVGRAGQLLTKIIESTKTWKREEVFIANVLKCRPPGNRPPQPEEVQQCLPYLKHQIAIIKPVLIMAMGTSAAQALLASTLPVGKLRNQWHVLEGVPLLVTYHPAALLRSSLYKRDVWEDMKKFTAKYKELVIE